jgi:hypothetical protein
LFWLKDVNRKGQKKKKKKKESRRCWEGEAEIDERVKKEAKQWPQSLKGEGRGDKSSVRNRLRQAPK